MAHSDLVKLVISHFNAKANQGIELTTEEATMLCMAEHLKNGYVISVLSPDDIAECTKYKEPLPEKVMEKIAQKMGGDYCEQLFWEHLPVITDIVVKMFKESE